MNIKSTYECAHKNIGEKSPLSNKHSFNVIL